MNQTCNQYCACWSSGHQSLVETSILKKEGNLFGHILLLVKQASKEPSLHVF